MLLVKVSVFIVITSNGLLLSSRVLCRALCTQCKKFFSIALSLEYRDTKQHHGRGATVRPLASQNRILTLHPIFGYFCFFDTVGLLAEGFGTEHRFRLGIDFLRLPIVQQLR
jgi:hypothetical protein